MYFFYIETKLTIACTIDIQIKNFYNSKYNHLIIRKWGKEDEEGKV